MYLVVDYERGNIDLYQAVYPESSVPSNIITICPVNSTLCSSGAGSNKIATDAIVGIAAAAVLILVLAALWYKLWRKKTPSSGKHPPATSIADVNRDSVATWVGGVERPELDASTMSPRSPRLRNELEGYYVPPKPELDSGYASRHAPAGSGSGNNPRDPRSVGIPAEAHEPGGAEVPAEAGGAEVHEMTAWQEQSTRNHRPEQLPGSPALVRHDLFGSYNVAQRPATSWNLKMLDEIR